MKGQYKELTDAQVLAQLQYKKVRLQWQLERVNIAIRAFETPINIDPLDIVQYELGEGENNVGVDDDMAKAILLYNPKSSVEKKVLFALKEISIGDTREITEYLLRIDGHIKDNKKLFNNVTHCASKMYREGKLNVVRAGKKNRYSLKD